MNERTRGLMVVTLAVLAGSCVSSEVTAIGPSYPPRGEGCAVDVFPATKPPYPYVDIANSRAKCHQTSGRTACIDQLKADACQAGADAVYAFSEGVMGEFTMISATLAHKTGEAKKEEAAPPAAPDGCNPPCSPGFACKATVCEPVCNPACEKGETCTRKRICEPTPTGT
jgi:hypothetical protein